MRTFKVWLCQDLSGGETCYLPCRQASPENILLVFLISRLKRLHYIAPLNIFLLSTLTALYNNIDFFIHNWEIALEGVSQASLVFQTNRKKSSPDRATEAVENGQKNDCHIHEDYDFHVEANRPSEIYLMYAEDRKRRKINDNEDISC